MYRRNDVLQIGIKVVSSVEASLELRLDFSLAGNSENPFDRAAPINRSTRSGCKSWQIKIRAAVRENEANEAI